MNVAKRQHFVPRFYLKQFTNNGTHTFLLKNGRIETHSIENMCVSSFCYEQNHSKPTNALERQLSKIEGRFSIELKHTILELQAIQKQMPKYNIKISKEVRRFLLTFMYHMYIRNPQYKDAKKMKNGPWVHFLHKELRKDNTPISNYRVVVLMHDGEASFISSSQPSVVLYDDMVYCMALTPTIFVMAVSEEIPTNTYNRQVISVQEEDVLNYNEFIYNKAGNSGVFYSPSRYELVVMKKKKGCTTFEKRKINNI